MITLFEGLLRAALTLGTSGVVSSPDHVRFVPPDAAWRAFVALGGDEYLNVHLVDLRENRALRSSDPTKPARLDCHYLITAWIKPDTLVDGAITASTTQRENQMLYAANQAIMNRLPFVPDEILGTGPASAWGAFHAAEIPLVLAPPDGFVKIPEFWGTLGPELRWKPVLYLIATLPVVRPPIEEGPPVTTMITDYEVARDTAAEPRVLIGGTARIGGKPAPFASVSLLRGSTELARTTAGADGRFSFRRIVAGDYQLKAMLGTQQKSRSINVPSLSGDYDVEL